MFLLTQARILSQDIECITSSSLLILSNTTKAVKWISCAVTIICIESKKVKKHIHIIVNSGSFQSILNQIIVYTYFRMYYYFHTFVCLHTSEVGYSQMLYQNVFVFVRVTRMPISLVHCLWCISCVRRIFSVLNVSFDRNISNRNLCIRFHKHKHALLKSSVLSSMVLRWFLTLYGFQYTICILFRWNTVFNLFLISGENVVQTLFKSPDLPNHLFCAGNDLL